MSPGHPKDNAKCKSDEHSKHLCYFVSYGYHVNNENEYKHLVDVPRFKCFICGRTAHCAQSLCDPRVL